MNSKVTRHAPNDANDVVPLTIASRMLKGICMLIGNWMGQGRSKNALVWLMSCVGFGLSANDGPIDFSQKVLPILRTHCFACHADRKQEGGLKLDRKEVALKGGDAGPVIVTGKSAKSPLIARITSADPEEVMPPKGDRLTSEQVQILKQWIDQGAHWPDGDKQVSVGKHWAYEPIRRPTPPRIDSPTIRNDIDRFVQAELRQRKITPAPRADRITLIRRLYLDLIGLLPSVAEVDAFVNDLSPNAYERLVDKLLASPHFGERWGRHWLDMARYADSDGYEKDQARPDAYLWRDWVINAVNRDMPFDQFTRQQLAGDLLPNATLEQKLATAFHRQTLTNTEGGADQEQFRVEACFDRTETTGTIWLGLTIGCARCHAHKYEAITQREYYQLFAFFNNGDEQSINVPKSAAETRAYEEALAKQQAAIDSAKQKLRAEQTKLIGELPEWERATHAKLQASSSKPLVRNTPRWSEMRADKRDLTFKQSNDDSVLVDGPPPDVVVYTLLGELPAMTFNTLRLDALVDRVLPGKGPGRADNGNFVLSELSVEFSDDPSFKKSRQVTFSSAKADFEQQDLPFRAFHVFDGDAKTGWAIAPQMGKPHWAEFFAKEPMKLEGRTYARIVMKQEYGGAHTLGKFRWTFQDAPSSPNIVPESIANVLNIAAEKRSAKQKQELLDHFSATHPKTKKLMDELAKLKKGVVGKPELAARVFVQRSGAPRVTRLLRRGEFLDPVMTTHIDPGGLGVLHQFSASTAPTQANRLDLANWLVSAENPLTPRVTVNHIWRQLFGVGIVKTANDFGVRGEAPSHPALLDWLADEFMHPQVSVGKDSVPTPWSRKRLIKLIVMSHTYQQSAKHRAELLETDPQNRLLARQNRLRVEGEIVRDLSLDAAGLLSRTIGGPSVYPPLPPGIEELSYAGNFKWKQSEGADRYRRGMYTFFKRTAPHPNLITFDCPDANLTCVDRNRSNTPLQALVTLNNETFAESAVSLARRIDQHRPTLVGDEARITHMFRICLARLPSPKEQSALNDLLANSRSYYAKPDHVPAARKLIGPQASNGDPAELASWVTLARTLLNLDEFVTRE